ncbi:hypothetical protein BD769DRAFT_1385563 [Suillus cothurnatus]|nr:hypothetical protein BD769DRAFT_1385563 [Suillus cothurnatus]
MEVDHSSSSSLESTNHDGGRNYLGDECSSNFCVLGHCGINNVDSGLSSRLVYQEDRDIALNDGTASSVDADGAELNFGLDLSGGATASFVDTEDAELNFGLDLSGGATASFVDTEDAELNFGLDLSGGATASFVDTEDAEPLDLGNDISPLPLLSSTLDVSDGDSMSDDGSELDFGLHLSDGATASSVDTEDAESLDLGIDISPLPLPNSTLDVSDRDSMSDDGSELDFGLRPSGGAMAHAHESSEYEAGPSFSIGSESCQSAAPPGGISSYTSTRYRHLPAWVSQRSLLPAVNEFNKEYRRRETLGFEEWKPELLSLPGAPTDDPIPAAADLYQYLTREACQAQSSPSAIDEVGDVSTASGHTQPPHEVSSQMEDLNIPLSEEELLKMSRSVLTLGRLNAVATGYAHRLVNEVAGGDGEQANPTLQEILDAERPFHVAYLETTDSFRKTLHDLQRAVRLHDQTLQLQAQLDAMIAAVEAQEQVFR